MKTKAGASATENKSCCARPLTLNRAGAMPSLTGQVVLFALPNNAMHPDLLQRVGSMKGRLVAASQTGDGSRWVVLGFADLQGFSSQDKRNDYVIRMPELYIVLKQEIPGFDCSVNGWALSKEDKFLANVAKSLQVKPLMEFFSQDPKSAADFLAGEGISPKKLKGKIPPAKWYMGKEGLQTVQALILWLNENPNQVKDQQRVLDELMEFQTVLKKVEEEGQLWHLAIDF